MNTLTLQLTNGQPTASSIDIARHFGKRHDTVLRAIANLDCSPEFTGRNFAASEYTDTTGRTLPAYVLTRDGFVFLAMGFTGKDAARWKEAYIDAFNRMEQTLRTMQPTPALPRPQPAYMAEVWFALLRLHAQNMLHCALARALGIHPSTLSQVLGGTGHYGTGGCSTQRIAQRVLRTFCPRRTRLRPTSAAQISLI